LLKNDLRVASLLIEHGMAFCHGWAKMLGAGPAYSPAGLLVAEPRSGSGAVSLEG
jgi:hypothetical protein